MSEDYDIEKHVTKDYPYVQLLTCAICQSIYKNPTRISCAHTFCELCIKEWLKKNANCPMCRKKVSKNQTGKDLVAQGIINKLEVKCPLKSKKSKLKILFFPCRLLLDGTY